MKPVKQLVKQRSRPFCPLSTAQWTQLEQQFGQAQVAHYFAPITADSKMFEMELDEASRLLKERKGR